MSQIQDPRSSSIGSDSSRTFADLASNVTLYRIIFVIFQEWFLDFNTKMTTLIFDEDEVELARKSEVK